MLVEIISCHIGSFLGYFVLLYGLLGVSVGTLHPLLTFFAPICSHLWTFSLLQICDTLSKILWVKPRGRLTHWTPVLLRNSPIMLSAPVGVYFCVNANRKCQGYSSLNWTHTHTHTSYSAALFNTITRQMFVLHHMMPGYTKGAGRRGDELLNCCTVHYLWKVDKVPISCSSYRCMTRWKWEKM